jgi:hypothetical protein
MQTLQTALQTPCKNILHEFLQLPTVHVYGHV